MVRGTAATLALLVVAREGWLSEWLFASEIARALFACGRDGTEYARTMQEEWEAEEEEGASIARAVETS